MGETNHFTTHAAERAAERYGVVASPAEWQQCVLDIIDSVDGSRRCALLMRRFADGVERWLVKLARRQIVAVYKPDEALIITVTLPSPSISHWHAPSDGRPMRRRTGGRWRPTEEDFAA